MIVAVIDPVLHRPVGEQAGHAAPTGFDQRCAAAHVEVCVVLARKAGIGQILRRGGAAHGDGELVAVFRHQCLLGSFDLGLEAVWQTCCVDELAAPRRRALQGRGVTAIHGVEQLAQGSREIVVSNQVPISLGGDCIAVRHRHTLAGQGLIHFAE
jgi:hypothetical protein